MNEEYRIEDARDVQSVTNMLDDKIYEFNSNVINKHDGALFAKIIQDDNGALVAGIVGWTWASVCEITLLWVREELRNKGFGKKLLMAAEEEAINKKCHTILVRSYSFQAPLFYERNGYSVECVTANFPHGYNYYTLKKNL